MFVSKVVALVGMPGAGKSLVSDYLRNKGYPIVHFGNIVVKELKDRGLELTQQNEQLVREDLRNKMGMDAIAQIAMPVISKILTESDIVIVDGLYSFSEYKKLKGLFGDTLKIIAIHCSPAIRHMRLSQRKERALTKEEAENRDYMEIERIEKGGPIALADYVIINESTENDAVAQIDKILNEILNN